MIKRTLSAFVAIALLFLLVAVDFLSKQPVINFALKVILLASLFEIYRALGFTKKIPLLIAGGIFGLLIFDFDFSYSFISMQAILVLAVISVFVIAVICHKKVSFSDISNLFFVTVYISAGMLHLKLLNNSDFGIAMVFMALVAAFLTDTGAYFSGYFFGKHKLIPQISPKKTVEGAIGGVIVAMLSMLVYAWVLTFFGIKVNLLNIVIIGGVASVLSQFGDLSASLIKRSLSIKDYGDIMPGHGGVLDRIDSLLFAAPAIYYLNMILPLLEEI